MDDAARKAAARERTRKRRADPVYRAAEYKKNLERYHADPLKHRAKHKAWKERQRGKPEYMARQAATTRAGYERLRRRLFAGYGGACSCCGEQELSFLELDHVNGGGKKEYAAKGAIQLYREVIRRGFPPEYRALCANCNRGRQRNGGICPHQKLLHDFLEELGARAPRGAVQPR